MKKKMIALLAGALMMLSAGSALASFGDTELEMFIYNGSTEIAVDLGNVNTLLSAPSTTITTAASAITGLGGTLYAGLMAVDDNGTGNVWITGKAGLAPFAASSAIYGSAMSAADSINNYYSGISNASGVAAGSRAAMDSYFVHMDQSANGLGNFGSLVPLNVQGDATTTLAAAVSKELYFLDAAGGSTNFVDSGYQATINTDGSITISQANAATPIPAAAWLLGSGLMGLFGLRRKNNS